MPCAVPPAEPPLAPSSVAPSLPSTSTATAAIRLPDGGTGVSGLGAWVGALGSVVALLLASPLLLAATVLDVVAPRRTDGTLFRRLVYDLAGHFISCRVVGRLFCEVAPIFRRVRFAWSPPRGPDANGPVPVALTIDDSPGNDPEAFADILTVLRARDVRATFFVTSSFVADDESDPEANKAHKYGSTATKAKMAELLKRAVRDGHELGHHMPEDTGYAGHAPDKFAESLERTEATLARLDGRAGVCGRWWRPPNAALTAEMADLLEGRGYRLGMGELYSNDHWIDCPLPCPATVAFHAAFIRWQVRPASVIVLHCAYSDGRGVVRRNKTAQVLDALLPVLTGYGVGTLSELADAAAAGSQPRRDVGSKS